MQNNPVLRTLIYESIFNFPLRESEIWNFLISDRKISKKSFSKLLKDKNIRYDKKTKLYYLKGKEESIRKRIKTEKIGARKLILARNVSSSLSKIPTIKLIGVSGSLALGGCEAEDDIDLFIVCRKNTVWTTRFFAVAYLKLKRIYREKKSYKDKICLNMIMDGYKFSQNRRDLYTAFEIAKLRPIFSRKKAHDAMIRSNDWIRKFMPNVSPKHYADGIDDNRSERFIDVLFYILEKLKFEKFAKFAQLFYMKKITNEEVSDNILAFHPRDFRKEILQKFEVLNREY